MKNFYVRIIYWAKKIPSKINLSYSYLSYRILFKYGKKFNEKNYLFLIYH